MGIELGRVSGQLLSNNLVRNGIDLAFETDLLYLDVNTGKIGINSDSPTRDLLVNSAISTTNLIVDTQADIADFTILSNKIQNPSGTINIVPNQLLDPTITGKEFRTADLKITNRSISTLAADVNIELTADGTGNIVFNTSKVNVNGNLHATGDITFDGDITFGSDDTDQVVFSSDIASNLIPDQNNLYSLGSPLKKWNTLYTTELITSDLTANTAVANDIDLLATQGTTLYVSVNGLDTNTGTHLHSPFKTIKHALSQAVSGDCIYVFPGDYEEVLPLLVPQGVSINGASIRATRLTPTPETKSNDVFLLNGETTVSNLTIKNFFYDPINDTGYGFRFAPNCKVTSRSPYVQNVTILNRGTYVPTGDVVDGDIASTISYDTIIDGTDAFATIFSEVIDGEWAFVIDPTLGFNSGDAGRGVLVDGSVVHPDSLEAAMLFHAVTLIVPNAEGITAKNGARVEWLNSFTYFANRGIHLTEGTEGFAGLGVRFGAEMRSINSANVYGNYGAVADGANTLGYLIGHNFGYVGSGYFSTNDPKLVNQANEIVPINGGRLYFDSMDQRGDFRIGDIFIVNQETGSVSFVAQTINFGANGSIVLEGVNGVTIIDLSGVQTGNIKVSGNTVQSLSGSVNIFAIDNHTNLGNNTFVTGNLDVTGDVHVGGNVYLGNNPLDLVNVVPRLTQNINPKTTNTFTLGETNKRWKTGFLNELNVDGVVNVVSNTISTLTTNTDLEFRSSTSKTLDRPTLTSILENPNAYSTRDDDWFGYGVAVSDLYIAIGAPYEDDVAKGSASGKVYVFDSVTKSLLFTITNPYSGYTISEQYGYSVAISGNYLIAGGPVYGRVYVHDLTTGTLLHTFTHPGPATTGGFGTSVAADGDYAIIGAPSAFLNYPSSTAITGKAYIFNLTTFSLEATLAPNVSRQYPNQQFGKSVDINGAFAIVGSPSFGPNTEGMAEVFRKISGAWYDTRVIDNPDPAYLQVNDRFGYSVAVSGDYAVVGAFNDSNSYNSAGKAYIINLYSGAVQTLNNPVTGGASSYDYFGWSVAAHGNYVVVGAYAAYRAYVYNLQTGSLLSTLNIDNTTGASLPSSSSFGYGVAISNNYIVAAAPQARPLTGELNSGRVGIFESTVYARILITSSDVEISNNLTTNNNMSVLGASSLQDITSVGTITLAGNINQTGDTTVTGTLTTAGTGNITLTGVDSYVAVPDITIQHNNISVTATNSDIVFTGTPGYTGVTIENKLNIRNNVLSNVWPSATTNNQKSIQFTPSGTGNLVVNSTSFLKVPYGNDSNKILSTSGEIRQNSTTGSYEGYLSTGPESFTNLYDVDRNTYITPELTVGANDNILRFGVNGTVRATINSTTLTTPAMQVGNLIFSGSTINNPFSGSNINLDPNGTGSLNLNDILVKDNTITNTKDSAIVLKNTGTGYVKFAGTYGVAFPYGDNSERRLTPETGESRYNTQLNYMEVFNGTTWIPAVGTLGAAPLAEVLDIMDFWGLILG